MRTRYRYATAAMTVAIVTAALQASSAAQTADAGRSLFVDYGCWQCHGYEGQGGSAGPRLAPSQLSFVAFEQFVRRPASVMPAFASTELADDKLRAIYDFLVSVAEPPPLGDIPELR